MPQRSDQLPPTPASLWQAVKNLQRDLTELRAARRLEVAAIGSGGISVTDGGFLKVLDTDGSTQFWIGEISPANPDGSPQRGMVVSRDDGTLAVTLSRLTTSTSDPQGLILRDARGGTLFAEDVATGGIAWPWLQMLPPQDAATANWPQTQAGSWTTMAVSYNVRCSPKMRIYMPTLVDGGTAGQVKVLIGGTQWGPTINAGDTFDNLDSFPDAIGPRDQFDITVQGQRTSGTGSLYAQVQMLYQTQT